ncbi:MAG TPA: ABC transporter substrate-binding protein [Bacteroidia bacterium]|jgi:putative ABC transport system substrate-binding protein|nr:ABC transporter substrate-binding protein [Bacteroidia bacterium]HOZ91191.1 ABC transporter substrate-binding protein [Bacteroidia bacterium]HQW17866.1 ABC transporter substrate-binding protein [Bacteroidia bacterium]HQW49185.1 ABC transporter substrate-binding protein [Bacteroidia bacterium]HQX69533.1 ABC transporter substrate-binding protein [Bacteroidia bacterium]
MKNLHLIIVAFWCLVSSCDNTSKNIPSIGFLDIAEDATLAKARTGFLDALSKNGFSEKDNTLKIYFSNAQGEIAVLNQACDYLISKNVKLIAANSTLSTIAAVQHSKDIPVCMMVAPRPDLAGLADAQGNYPKNLFGVFETLAYIDSSVALIKRFFPDAVNVGTIYNSSEPQSRDALEELQKAATTSGMKIIALPVTNSSETQLVTQSLIAKKPDVFFALPDNVIFASFETVVKACNEAQLPVFTSEAGLVSRGAIASYGADFYQWGFQAGVEAANYLKSNTATIPKPELVQVRQYVFNNKAATRFNLVAPNGFIVIDSH